MTYFLTREQENFRYQTLLKRIDNLLEFNEKGLMERFKRNSTVGIIGFGSFGLFLAEQLDPYVGVLGYSSSGKAGKWSQPLREVAGADFLIFSIPLDAYETTLDNVKPVLGAKTVIVDVCSVKEKPLEIIKRNLPNQPVVSTHPLFGPESASQSLEGHVLVMCPEDSDRSAYDKVRQFSQKLGLKIEEMSAKEHDQEMATIHGLTFFIAHSLKDMRLHSQKLSTPSFKKLLDLANLEKHHSDELFKTIQAGNAYTAEVRQKFIKEIQGLNDSIT